MVVPKKVTNKKTVNKSALKKETAIIFQTYGDLLQSDQKTTEFFIQIGKHLIAAQKLAKKEKVLWEDYCTNTLSRITRHEIRDCMYIASRYSANPLPSLFSLNRTNLYKFFQFCKGKSPQEVLTKNRIDLIDEDASAEEISAFQNGIKILLQSAKKKKVPSKRKPTEKLSSNHQIKQSPKLLL